MNQMGIFVNYNYIFVWLLSLIDKTDRGIQNIIALNIVLFLLKLQSCLYFCLFGVVLFGLVGFFCLIGFLFVCFSVSLVYVQYYGYCGSLFLVHAFTYSARVLHAFT